MPKLGLKCFFGSFLLSLVAVFAVTKAYFVLSMHEQEQVSDSADVLPVKNIELFAASEENDPIYEKFNTLNRQNELPSESSEPTIISKTDNQSYTDDEVLYQPDVAENSAPIQSEETVELANTESPTTDEENDENVLSTASNDTENSEELQIADASTAPIFKIPLVHNYKTENGTVTYSESADDNQVASASRDVPLENLGTDNAAALTEPLMADDELIASSGFADGLNKASAPKEEDSPWKVAKVSDKHSTKNTYESYEAKHQADIVAPDQEVTDAPHEEYRMQENILVPIPESIKNERNLTPQFSTSEENLKLERELRAKHQLPALDEDKYTGDEDDDSDFMLSGDENDEELDFDEDEETSKSLTDSIAEWFSGSKKKETKDNITAPDTQVKKKEKSSQSNESSIFNKLLGIGKGSGDSIAPSELKLSFQPNRAEISGQTLEWLHAFSDNSVKNEDVFIEIRIDKSAPYALQEKRLKLLYKILAGNGVDYHKINIIFTDREPNSFIIRNVRYASEEEKVKAMKRADNPWY